MFIKSIEDVDRFTKPIHTITRTYAGLISPGTSTLFFVNEFAVAVTCRHVMQLIAEADQVNSSYSSFTAERNGLPRDNKFKQKLLGLETKYKFKKETLVQIRNRFMDCVDNFTTIDCIPHPTLDLAILKFAGHQNNLYSSYATFVRDQNKIKQGQYLCRLGYPFPEFTNFQYNQAKDDIEWTNTGNPTTPKFPIDGIITRFGLDADKAIATIEMSTPGLRGQSGGPLFDTEGLIYGMQSMTNHLHLGFDLKDKEVLSDGKKIKVSNHPFLHVGHCIHANRIKEFLGQQNIKFYEES